MYIYAIEFNLDFHPIQLENFRIAQDMMKGVKQIKQLDNKIIYISKFEDDINPYRSIIISKGISILIVD